MIKEYFEFVGFVPLLVKYFIKQCALQKHEVDIEATIQAIKSKEIYELETVLNEDTKRTSPELRFAYIRALASTVAGGLCLYDRPYLVHRNNVSWTFVKETDGLLKPVSPLALQVVKLYLSTDVASQLEVVSTVNYS